eukprot:SRR837773.4775.p1 GENE.SRR837773.4775~~SRR837773.4775.p1  ORF type:complete len:534 (-),score=29.97 SRR837773.4775:137-1660(-)
MGALTLSSGDDGACTINASAVPASGFVPGTSYDISVVASRSSLYKFYSSDGQCLGIESSMFKVASAQEFVWTAPSQETPVSLFALCSPGINQVFAASAVLLSPAGRLTIGAPGQDIPEDSGPSAAGGEISNGSLSGSPSDVAESLVGRAQDLALGDSGMTLAYEPLGVDGIRVTVSTNRRTWLGFGFSQGEAISMTGSRRGSDVFVCSDGEVRRYWIVGLELSLADGRIVRGAECRYVAGVTTMMFNRSLVGGLSSGSLDIVPGKLQPLIFAHGEDGTTRQGYHGTAMRGGIFIDLGSGLSKQALKPLGELAMICHVLFMCAAWACFLPLGAVIANRFRHGRWYSIHIRVQTVGWCLQLAGCGLAFWHCQRHSVHLRSLHAWVGYIVTGVGTLQPLNALLRPHPEPKTVARRAFEVIHRGFGWSAILMAVVNIFLGIWMVRQLGLSGWTVGLASLTAACCLSVPLMVLFFGCDMPTSSSLWLRIKSNSKGDGKRPAGGSEEFVDACG